MPTSVVVWGVNGLQSGRGLAEIYLHRGASYFGGVYHSAEDALVLFLGAPLEATQSFRGGTRFAPQRLRFLSEYVEFYSLRSGVDVEDVRISDLGDVAMSYTLEESLRRIGVVVGEVFSRDKLLVVAGGEHTITYAVIDALRRRGATPCVLVFDAHFDLRDEYLGSKLGHATVMRRISELVTPRRLFFVGVRGFEKDELAFARREGVGFVTSLQAPVLGPREIMRRIEGWLRSEECRHLHTSIDMDVFDPAYAPGVANPEAEGLSPALVLDVLAGALRRWEGSVSVDVVEYTPVHDCGDATGVLSVHVVVEAIAAFASTRLRG